MKSTSTMTETTNLRNALSAWCAENSYESLDYLSVDELIQIFEHHSEEVKLMQAERDREFDL